MLVDAKKLDAHARWLGGFAGVGFLAGALALPGLVPALELSGDINACHDPTQIIKEGGVFRTYSTAPNVNRRRSTDLVNWSWEPRAFNHAAGVPPWMAAIGQSLGSPDYPWNIWAPEIFERQGTYFLFYSRNFWSPDNQEEISACGVATTTSLAGNAWTDVGEIITTDLFGDNYRVIDPAVIEAPDGRVWMSVGSFGSPNTAGYLAGGLYVFELDPETGLRLDPEVPGTRVAGSWIEAPYIFFRDGFYYLFFNQGRCCAGLNSTYYLRVGRSTSVTGPYTDMMGRSLLNPTHGGSLFLGRDEVANYNNGAPRDNFGSLGHEVGPGHAGILAGQDGFDRFSYHYYDGDTPWGEPTLGIKTMVWTESGWPRAGFHLADGTYTLQNRTGDDGSSSGVAYLDLLGQTSDTTTLRAWDGSQSQSWSITRVLPNHYRIESARTGKALAAAPDGTTTLVDYNSSSAAHRWFAEQTSDGAFRLLNGLTRQALDLEGASTRTTPWAHAESQRWWIAPTGIYALENTHSGLAAGVPDDNAGTQLDQFDYFGSDRQKWRLIPASRGHVAIEGVAGGLRLGTTTSPGPVNAPVVQLAPTPALAQQWSVEPLPDGSRRLINRASAHVLDNPSRDSLALARQSEWLHIRSQQWALELLHPSPLGLAPEDPEPTAQSAFVAY